MRSRSLSPDECKAIQEGSPCEPREKCKIHDGCGLNGYTCRDGKWKSLMKYCNPARPEKVPESK